MAVSFVVKMHYAFQQHFIVMVIMIALTKVMKQIVQRLHVQITNSYVQKVAKMVRRNALQKHNYAMVNVIARMEPMKKLLVVSFAFR